MQRDRGQCFIQVEAAVVDRMRAMRRPGESYSHVILRLVELETGPPQTVVARTPIAAAGNVSKGRIVLKNSNFRIDHNSGDRWRRR